MTSAREHRSGGSGADAVAADPRARPAAEADRPPASAPSSRLALDAIAAAMARLVDRAVADAGERQVGGSLMTVGIYGPPGSGKSTLMRAVRGALGADAWLPVAINPWMAGERDSVYVLFHDRTLDQLAPRFFVLRSLAAVRVVLWLSAHPWIFGSALLLLLLALAFLLDASLSWQMLDDVYHAWRTAKTGEELRAVRYIMEWYPIGLLAQAVPWVAAGLPLLLRIGPQILRQVGSRYQVAAATNSAEGLQRLYRDLAAMAKARRRTLAFFVDDLDRCTPSRVAEIVESIQGLRAAGCVVFVACDDDTVSAALNAHYRSVVDTHRDGRSFGRNLLAGIVQVPFRVPAVDEAGEDPAPPRDAAPDRAQAKAILDETVEAFVRPLGLPVRLRRSIADTIGLHLDLGAFADAAEARRLAAAVLADMVAPAWLDAHALGEAAPPDSALRLHGDVADRLARAIGRDEAGLRRIYLRLGRRPRPRPAPAADTTRSGS